MKIYCHITNLTNDKEVCVTDNPEELYSEIIALADKVGPDNVGVFVMNHEEEKNNA